MTGGGPSIVINEIISNSEDKIDHSILTVKDKNHTNEAEKYYPKKTKFYYVTSDFFPLSCVNYRLKYNEIKDNDIFHFHNFPVGREYLLFRLLASQHKKIVLSFHIDIDNLMKNAFMKKYYYLLFRKTFRYWNKIIFHSKQTLQQSKIKYKIPEELLTFLPIGVNLDFIRNVKAKKITGNPSIVFVGHLTPLKGIDLLLHAFNKILINNCDAVLHIIGNMNIQKYQSMAEHLEIINNVKFWGDFQDRRELISLVKGCDFCVFPSRYDTFNIAALEAIASNKPAIISKNCGIFEELQHKQNILFIDPNITQIAEAMEKFIENKEAMNSINKEDDTIVDMYDWKNIIPLYLNFYKMLYHD
jgi:glycosyltransferase involved in cell wall biosynthesis